jgi:hypothetical protein
MNNSSLRTRKNLDLKGRTLLKYSIALFTLLFITFQSCNKDDDSIRINEAMNKKLEYLDTDVSNLPSLSEHQMGGLKNANISEQQMVILKKARARIDSFVVYENKAFKLKITSGSQIQMSERLFEYFKAIMNQTNSVIKDLNVVPDKKDHRKLHVVKQLMLNSQVRLKSGDIETTPAYNTTDYVIGWSGVDLYISKHDLELLAWGCGVAALFGTLCPEFVISKAAAWVGGIAASSFTLMAVDNPGGVVISVDWLLNCTVSAQTNGTW